MAESTTPTSGTERRCPACAAPVEPGAPFCTACGAAQPSSRTRRGVVGAALAAAIAAALVIAGILWPSDDDQGGGPVVVAEPIEAPTTSSASSTTVDPTTTVPSTTTTTGPSPSADPDPTSDAPELFGTPEEAIASWLASEEPAYAGTCESLAGREADLGGAVLCSVLDEDRRPQQIHRWGVFATDDLRGWLLLDVGSAGWSVADASIGEERPGW